MHWQSYYDGIDEALKALSKVLESKKLTDNSPTQLVTNELLDAILKKVQDELVK